MPTEPMKVLFVCTGNICRSPVAERMLQQRGSQHGLDLVVSSAGTRALNGMDMHPESVRVLQERGIDPKGFTSRLLTPKLTADADLILGLSREHRAAARQLAPVRWRDMFALREIAAGGEVFGSGFEDRPAPTIFEGPNDRGLDIKDPIGRSAEVFDSVAEDIEATMGGLVDRKSVV